MKLKIEVAFAHSRISRQSCAFLVEGKTKIAITTVNVHGLLVCYKKCNAGHSCFKICLPILGG